MQPFFDGRKLLPDQGCKLTIRDLEWRLIDGSRPGAIEVTHAHGVKGPVDIGIRGQLLTRRLPPRAARAAPTV